ncbi:autophagy 12 [Fusarium beomiforme]|uniref:Ubiquitin-like protein ATG12 n=1 Tax=Fusarium beomiforme TaxID=44412 RepID=A0A9P5DWX3_9HYPO|nr:autophagy 12 [Fusarium beomiforme]
MSDPPQEWVPSTSPSPSPSTASPMPLADNEGAGSGAASPNLPLTMSASVVLADLPRDASAALAAAGAFSADKVVVRFKPVGSAPSLAQDVCKISATRRFEEVVRYLRKKLRCKETDSVFLYVNSAFAPSLDEVVGNLHQCFKNAHGQLVVAYSLTPAFG